MSEIYKEWEAIKDWPEKLDLMGLHDDWEGFGSCCKTGRREQFIG